MATTEQRLGAGLRYREELHEEILRHHREIDFLEIKTDQFVHASPALLARLTRIRGEMSVVPHGAGLSVGTAAPVNGGYVEEVRRLVDALGSPWFSDHLAFSRVPDRDVGQTLPLWFTEEALEVLRRNVSATRAAVQRPLLLENITYYFPIPHGEMSEADFLSRAVVETDSGLLLDLNNLHVNAMNFSFDPFTFLSQIPLERVHQIHVGGSRHIFGMVVDSHEAPVHEEVWKLLEYVVRHSPARGVVLEWDRHFPPFSVLRDHLGRIRHVLRRFGAGRRAARGE